ncbi:ubiquitin carboxyl-terminal hydrolase 32-like [Lineus longissimus]|uniref:ubiquitin carboxyl-terminal hydrolase 32-like n=1 Tax=Lineus longissimus TaxID=88925 RepID=UPI002B4CB3F3
MGAEKSKLCFITYEDAVKRVSEAELKRLKDAFKRTSTINGYMTKILFVREVLGDGVPASISEQIFLSFGAAQRGLNFRDLVCGLVLVTRGNLEERIKFIFGFYAYESLPFVSKSEMDRLVLATEGQVPAALSELFLDRDKVTYDLFRTWILKHPDVTSLTKWLLFDSNNATLTSDSETPTFYQTLAGVTHLEETDIIELEKRYWTLKAQSKSGRFDTETFQPLISPPVPESLCCGLFNAFDENRDNHIDFKEMACGVSACCRGPMTERQKFCFKIFDQDRDSLLSKSELVDMVVALLAVRKDNKSDEELEYDNFQDTDPTVIVTEILDAYDSDKDGKITLEEYLVWTVNHPLPENFVNLLFQVCHIVLGLKPQNRKEEGQIVREWLARDERHGLMTNQIWYLIAMPWWRSWFEYVTYSPSTTKSQSQTVQRSSSQRNKSPYRYNTLQYSQHGSKMNNAWGENSNVVIKSITHHQDEVSPINLPNGNVSGNCGNSASKTNSLPRKWNGYGPHPVAYPHLSPNLTPTSSPGPSPQPSPSLKRYTTNGVPSKPGAIDNNSLIDVNLSKVTSLTNEGGKLKRTAMLARSRDFELVPEPVWKALHSWYGGTLALPRAVIRMRPTDHTPELEMYPIHVKLLRHQVQNTRPNQQTSFTGMMAGIGGMTLSAAGISNNAPPAPRRYLAYTAAFSRKHTLKQVYDFLCSRLRINREDIRLWKCKDEQNMTLLEEEEMTMEDLGIEDNQNILIEVRNKDLTWPEEMSQLARNKNALDRKQQVPTEKGATGLSNLGNTCYMNAAVQCVSNTWPLTYYFTSGIHKYEMNRDNPLGMKGHIAQRYGDLVKDLWSGTMKSTAPLRLRWTIGKNSPTFKDFQQHDSQELLAFLLDGLHEDLNRVHNKPYVELKDSDGRPDEEVAKEAWENHLLRNKSVIVDLFHGQLKSQVRCIECGHISVRFDPFSVLSLPLPMDSCIHLEIIMIKLDGSVPVKYGLRLNMDEKYKTLKKQLSEHSNIPFNRILLVELFGAVIKSLPDDNQKIKTMLCGSLYAYELAPPPQIAVMTVAEERGLTPSGVDSMQRLKSSYSARSLNESYHGYLPPIESPNTLRRSDDALESDTNNGLVIVDHSDAKITRLSNGDFGSGMQTSDTEDVNGDVMNGEAMTVLVNGVNNNGNSTSGSSQDPDSFNGFIVAMHRKMIRMDVYYLSSHKTRPSVFGTPLILPCFEDTKNQDIYQSVWTQVSRLVSPLPPSEVGSPNHAMDCDDSLGYEYPFTLKKVQKDGVTCAKCPWYQFCRGCRIDCDASVFRFASSYIAIDWEPTAIHLRYQTSQEKVWTDHESVEISRRQQTEPIDLDTCLKAFTKEEELGEDELYYCSKCKKHRLAAKRLEIWKLPPMLIIHMKRFQFLNGRWVKSQKIVNFPHSNFDPTHYLAERCPLSSNNCSSSSLEEQCIHNGPTNHDRASVDMDQSELSGQKNSSTVMKRGSRVSLDRESQGSGDGNHLESSQRKIENNNTKILSSSQQEFEDYTNARYNLYAISSHSGIMGGGHYVAYAKNPNNKWYCYNDSSCKEVQSDQIDHNSAYILFYERAGLEYKDYMPSIEGKEPDLSEIDDEFESDFKKMCSIQ